MNRRIWRDGISEIYDPPPDCLFRDEESTFCREKDMLLKVRQSSSAEGSMLANTRLSPPSAMLFGIGFVLGLFYLPIALEMGVTSAYQSVLTRTFIGMLFPVALALTGIGALFAVHRPGWASRHAFRFGGVGLLVHLFVALRLTFWNEGAFGLLFTSLCHLGAMGAWYTALGAWLTETLSAARDSATALAQGWSAHLAGAALGYLCCEPAVESVGVNALLFTAGCVFVLIPRVPLLVLVPALGLAYLLDADERLESWRVLGPVVEAIETESGHRLSDEQIPRDFLGWSRDGQVQVWVPKTETQRHRIGQMRLVLYNYRFQYEVKEWANRNESAAAQRTGLRGYLYPAFSPEEPIPDGLDAPLVSPRKAMMIGTGGGNSLSLLQPLHKGVFAVQRDRAILRFLTEELAKANSFAFLESSVVNADARFALDTSMFTMDAIALEGARTYPWRPLLSAVSADYLYTREGFATALGRLRSGGILVAEFDALTQGNAETYLPEQTRQGLLQAGANVLIYNTDGGDKSTLLGCVGDACLLRWIALIEQNPSSRIFLPEKWAERRGTHWSSANTDPLTDDRPFPAYLAMESSQRSWVVRGGGVLLGLALFGGLIARRHARGLGWNATHWFLALGLAQAAFQLHAFHAWRTYWGDTHSTASWMLIGWLCIGSVVAATAPRWAPFGQRHSTRLKWMLGVLFVHLLATTLLPYWLSSGVGRFLFGVVALVPGGLLLGLGMPLGLLAAAENRVGVWFAASAFGALAATGLMYLLMLPVGITVFAAVPVVMYLWLAHQWRPLAPAIEA